MIRAKLLSLLAVVFGSIIGLAQPVAADTVTFDLNFEFSGATAPEGTAPWISATFQDTGAGDEVTLTLTTLNLVDSEFVREWLFNFDTTSITDLSVDGTPTCSSGCPFTVDLGPGPDSFKADGDGFFDLQIDFSRTEGDRFEAGETVTIVFTGDGLDALDFAFLSAPGGGAGSYGSAAHVQGIGWDDEDSGWIGDDPDLDIGVVPIPAAAWLFGSALVGLIGMSRIRKRRRA